MALTNQPHPNIDLAVSYSCMGPSTVVQLPVFPVSPEGRSCAIRSFRKIITNIRAQITRTATAAITAKESTAYRLPNNPNKINPHLLPCPHLVADASEIP